MTTYFISRHPGARAWASRQPLQVDCWVDHLDLASIQPGDTVIGTLPVNLAAEVCQRGGKYVHLSLELPATARGQELTAEQMKAYGVRLQAYRVSPLPNEP